MNLLKRLTSIIWGSSRKDPLDSSEKSLYIYVQDELLRQSNSILKSYGNKKQAHEGILYWAGISTQSAWFITTCISPMALTTRGSYSTDVKANAKVISFINKYNLNLLAQVHSHPGKNVDHSDGDNRGALMPYEGFLSIVVPEYGMRGMQPLDVCGIHRYESGEFKRLPSEEIRDLFRILPLSHDMWSKEVGKDVYV